MKGIEEKLICGFIRTFISHHLLNNSLEFRRAYFRFEQTFSKNLRDLLHSSFG